ncbi:MAG: CHRD domain-containing protein [Nitrospinae bacterium]|nr:CHRD domain-containing protein [Nitrospinota bacterium]
MRKFSRIIKIALAVPIASMLVLAALAVPASAQNIKTLIAVLNAGQEFFPPTNEPPDNPSNSFGVAFMTFNERTKELCYSISYTSLVASETAAHFHRSPGAGVAGGVIFPISPSPSPLGSPKTGCVGPFNRTQRGDLLKGLFYINIHSTSFPGGEIRGQVLVIK